ncbi:MAG: orotate phosphoribosyltransferase [bacterium]
MTEDEILATFTRTGALLSGHFVLTSGLHSKHYFQCARVLQHPELAEKFCSHLAQHFNKDNLDAVVAPAIGGILVAHEMARALGVRSLFTEREHGTMTLRRGFELKKGERILVVEDVVTTGGSAKEVLSLVRELGGQTVAVASLVDRSGGQVDFGLPYHSLISLQIQTYPPNDPELANLGPAVKPGSRSSGQNG